MISSTWITRPEHVDRFTILAFEATYKHVVVLDSRAVPRRPLQPAVQEKELRLTA